MPLGDQNMTQFSYCTPIQVSYLKSARKDTNHWPSDKKASDLPTELATRYWWMCILKYINSCFGKHRHFCTHIFFFQICRADFLSVIISSDKQAIQPFEKRCCFASFHCNLSWLCDGFFQQRHCILKLAKLLILCLDEKREPVRITDCARL